MLIKATGGRVEAVGKLVNTKLKSLKEKDTSHHQDLIELLQQMEYCARCSNRPSGGRNSSYLEPGAFLALFYSDFTTIHHTPQHKDCVG